MAWNNNEIKKHQRAALLLTEVMDEAFLFIEKNQNTTELEVERFIYKQFDKKGLTTSRKKMTVAFDENSTILHYRPWKNCKRLKPGTYILIDIWARLKEKNSPYVDIAWSGYFGENIPKKIQTIFNLICKARDESLKIIEAGLKNDIFLTGKEIHAKTCQLLIDRGYQENIKHSTGHTLGFHYAHGKGQGVHLGPKGDKQIQLNLGYATEPGLYFENEFGLRSEINFYIDEKYKIHVTTPPQKEIYFINSTNICS